MPARFGILLVFIVIAADGKVHSGKLISLSTTQYCFVRKIAKVHRAGIYFGSTWHRLPMPIHNRCSLWARITSHHDKRKIITEIFFRAARSSAWERSNSVLFFCLRKSREIGVRKMKKKKKRFLIWHLTDCIEIPGKWTTLNPSLAEINTSK